MAKILAPDWMSMPLLHLIGFSSLIPHTQLFFMDLVARYILDLLKPRFHPNTIQNNFEGFPSQDSFGLSLL